MTSLGGLNEDHGFAERKGSPMFKSTAIVLFFAVLAGCGGLRMTSITTTQAEMAHDQEGTMQGYIVYHPMLVVTLKENGGVCKIDGEPVVLPDYRKPFLLEIEPGLSRYNVDLRIEDGWRLGGATAEVDSTAWMELAMKALGAALTGEVAHVTASISCTPGLNKLVVENGVMTFAPLGSQ